MRPRSLGRRVGHADRGVGIDAGAVEQPLSDRPDEEAGERALQAVRFHRAAGGGDLGEQRRHSAPLGRLGELQPVQRGGVLRKMAIEVGEASRPQLGLLAKKVGLERQREGLVCPGQRLGARPGWILAELHARIELGGDGARLRR